MSQKDDYASRIERLLYSRTNEKPVVVELLTNLFKNKRFGHCLDVGPGPGLVTEPLAKAGSHLTLVEVDPAYERSLREKYPRARVVIGSIADFPLEKYDAILASQTLYYHRKEEWLPVCRRLFEALNAEGMLVIILNRDSGDLWRVIDPFWKGLREHLRFHYRRPGKLAADLEPLGPLRRIPLGWRISLDSVEELAEFIGRQALQIYDEKVLRENGPAFRALAETIARENGAPALNVDAEAMVLTRG